MSDKLASVDANGKFPQLVREALAEDYAPNINTGLLDIRHLINGYVGGDAQLWREGQTVHLNFYNLKATGQETSGFALLNLPEGFSAAYNVAEIGGIHLGTGDVGQRILISSTTQRVACLLLTAGEGIFKKFTFNTTDAPPVEPYV